MAKLKKTTSKTKTINLAATMHSRIKMQAAKEGVNINQLVDELLEIGLVVKEKIR